jgi:hypothetical protein
MYTCTFHGAAEDGNNFIVNHNSQLACTSGTFLAARRIGDMPPFQGREHL